MFATLYILITQLFVVVLNIFTEKSRFITAKEKGEF